MAKRSNSTRNDDLVILLRGTADGDRAAFSDLYWALERPLAAFVHLRLNDSSEVADILNETFLEVWKRAGTFEGRSAVKSWVYAIAYRKVVDVVRKRQKVVVSDKVPERVDPGMSPEASLLSAETGAYLRCCLHKLKDGQRVAVRLAFFDDMSYREIASITGVPEGTVKSRVYHAKQALLHCLKGRLSREDLDI